MKAKKIQAISISVARPELDYLRAMEDADFCQVCGCGLPIFECEYTYAEGEGLGGPSAYKYCCKECVIGLLEHMRLYGLELWRSYKPEMESDDPLKVELEEHRRRVLQSAQVVRTT